MKKLCCHLRAGDVLDSTEEVVTRLLWTPGLQLALVITDQHAHTYQYDDLFMVTSRQEQ